MNEEKEAVEQPAVDAPKPARGRAIAELLAVSTKLGLTSFGGPIAHLGYFHEEYIKRRKWLDERTYADLVALCQFLPGPASSQVGIGIGVLRAGLWGGLAAWIGFTLPSAIALLLFALLLKHVDVGGAGWVHGLKLVAVAIVAQAVWSMGQKLAAGRARATIAVGTAAIMLLWQTAFSQVLLIVLAGLIGVLMFQRSAGTETPQLHVPIRRSIAILALLLFFALLIGLPIMRGLAGGEGLALFDSFYRSGSLVFGGGHVVLPLLEREVVPTGWVGKESFLAGYGATQAVPGPLFTFSAYLGAAADGVRGAAIALAAIFLPAFLLVIGALPFWGSLRQNPRMQGALAGVNAAVVGILLAALYQPIWTAAVVSPHDLALAVVLFLLLVVWKLPPWAVVLVGAAGGTLLAWLA